MINKKFLVLFAFLILFAGVQAKSYPINEPFDLKVICFSNGYCSGAAVCNTTVFYPNNDLLLDNVAMTNNINYYNFTINGSLINQLGVYDVGGFCSDAGNTQEIDFTFTISNDGEEVSLEKAYIYIITFAMASLFFILLSFLYFRLEKTDINNDSREILRAEKEYGRMALIFKLLKYELHTVLLMGLYLLFFGISYIGYGMTREFGMETPETFFYILSTLSGVMFLPVMIFLVIYVLAKLFHNIFKMLDLKNYGYGGYDNNG